MLIRLVIRDFVLVPFLELDFNQGFGALTGETGAGKSILIDALSFALGERADSGVIKAGCERAEVSAEFDLVHLKDAKKWLVDNDLYNDDTLILRRLVDVSGRSRAYVNGSPVNATQIRELADFLLDIHGQHAHQSLLKADAQRHLLDSHAKLLPLTKEVSEAFKSFQTAQKKWVQAKSGAQNLAQEKEDLNFEIKELSALDFSLEAWNDLNTEHKRLAHATRLVDGAQAALTALCEDEISGQSRLEEALSRVNEMADFDPSLSEIVGNLHAAQAELAEAISNLRRYADRLELDPNKLTEVEERIDAVLSACRKYRISPEDFALRLAKSEMRLAELGEIADIEALEKTTKEAEQTFLKKGKTLSAARKKAAETLSGEVSKVMQSLALAGGRFEIALIPLNEGCAFGLESIEFRLAGVAGNAAKTLAKVASGGELSRISLAISVITSQAVDLPTLIFDEVDVGIGGGVAEIVGKLLRELGQTKQVLCVTHLPQVASRANWQWKVVKNQSENKVESALFLLDENGRIEEIARMLGGVKITELTREHAKEMLGF